MTKFINTELESDLEQNQSESESNQSQSQSKNLTLNNCNTYTHNIFVLNYRCLLLKWLLSDFNQVKNLVAILLTLNRSKT